MTTQKLGLKESALIGVRWWRHKREQQETSINNCFVIESNCSTLSNALSPLIRNGDVVNCLQAGNATRPFRDISMESCKDSTKPQTKLTTTTTSAKPKPIVWTPRKLPDDIHGIPQTQKPLSTTGVFRFLESDENQDRVHADGRYKLVIEKSSPPAAALPSQPTTTTQKPIKLPTACTVSNPFPCAEWLYPASIHQQTCNEPVEDRGLISMCHLNSGNADTTAAAFMLAAVVDGHSGWQVSEYVSRVLAARIQTKLASLADCEVGDEELSKVIVAAFEELDKEIFTCIVSAAKLGFSSCAKPGATTSLCLINDKKLVSATLGDSIAVLSRNGRAISLGEPHNAGQKREQEILKAKHPNESDAFVRHKPASLRREERENEKKNEIAKCESAELDLSIGGRQPNNTTLGAILTCGSGQVLGWGRAVHRLCLASYEAASSLRSSNYFGGSSAEYESWPCYTKGRLQLTRAFGDFYLKNRLFQYDYENDRTLLADPVSYPYLSAVPEIKCVDRVVTQDEFVLIASDGLWDFFKYQDAVNFVNRALRETRYNVPETLESLKMEVLRRATKEAKKGTVDQVLHLSPKDRRNVYDDLTMCLVLLKDAQGPINRVPA